MPYRRKAPTAIVRRRRRKTTAPSRKVSTAVKKYVRRALPSVEMKNIWYHDNEVSLNTLVQGAMQAYPLIANGNSNITRVGSEISLKSMQVKGMLYNNSGSESYARLIIVGHPGTIDPTYTTFPIFKSASSGTSAVIGTINGLDAMYYPINTTELTVYHDQVMKLAGTATAGGPSNTRMFSKFIKWPGKGKKIMYKANTSGYNNQNWMVSVFWIVADANDDTSTGTTVELSQLTRVWFTDC